MVRSVGISRAPRVPLIAGFTLLVIAVGLAGALWFSRASGTGDGTPSSALPPARTVPTDRHVLEAVTGSRGVTGWAMYEPLVGLRDVAVDDEGLVWVTEQNRATTGTFDGSTLTRFLAPKVFADSGAFKLAPGPGGMWYSGYPGGSIARILPDAKANAFSSIAAPSATLALAEGPGQVMWATDVHRGSIVRIDTRTGSVADLPVPIIEGSPSTPDPYDIVRGPDDAMWFTNPSLGTVTEIVTGGPLDMIHHRIGNGRLGPRSIVSDGTSLWVTLADASAIAKVDPATGDAVVIRIPSAEASLNDLAIAPDGSLWLTQASDQILHVRPNGELIAAYRIPNVPGADLGADGIAVGPDGSAWAAAGDANLLIEIDPRGAVQ